MFKSIKRLAILAAVLGAAIVPAVASARPILPDRQPYTVTQSTLQVSPPVAHQVAATSDPGFSWHDAGLGAAGMLVLVGIGAGTAVAVRRRAVLS